MSTSPVTPPTSFTFQTSSVQQLTWNLVDITNAPITGATVTATLYANRSRTSPTTTPGTPDPNFNNISLVETPALSGTYVGTIGEAFNPVASATTWFVLVITASQGSSILRVFEIPAIVIPEQNTIDLVTIDDVKSYLNLPLGNTDDDKVLQLIISGFSQYVLNATGRASFKQVTTYTETYDGNGNTRLMLRNSPALSLISLNIGGYGVPQSPNVTTSGVYIEDSGKSIAFRWSGGALFPPQSIYPYFFTPGQGNIQVTYTAGYSSVPFDLYEICMETVAVFYRRKDWVDLASKSLSTGGGASGTTTYRQWHLTPAARMVLNNYTRYSHT